MVNVIEKNTEPVPHKCVFCKYTASLQKKTHDEVTA